MNVGDSFFTENTIKNVFQNLNSHKDILYGNHQVIYPHQLVDKFAKNLSKFWKGMPIQHQSIFFHRTVFHNFIFNTHYKYAADYDLIYYLFCNSYKFLYVNEIVCQVSANGFSESNAFSTLVKREPYIFFNEYGTT
jgi:hypothetical protein